MESRNTKVKSLVTAIFQNHQQPLSLKEVFDEVKRTYPHTAYSTVFRIIKQLHTRQQLVQVDWRERGSYFEWAQRHHHHHLVCDTCGEVVDIEDSVLGFKPDSITQQTGFIIKNHSIEIKGTCRSCQ